MSSKPHTYYPEPYAGEATDLPIDPQADVVLVHTELGVPIYFRPLTAQFTAQISGVEGKGSTSELRSADFASIVARVRARALVIPVEACLLSIDEQAADDEDLVVVIPCTVIEHHPRRGEPFVIRVPEEVARATTSAPYGRRPWIVHRVRTATEVYLPTLTQLERLRQATQALRDEHVRHRAEVDRLGARQRVALNAVRKLDAEDLARVQETGTQLTQSVEHAREPDELDGLVFELVGDDDA